MIGVIRGVIELIISNPTKNNRLGLGLMGRHGWLIRIESKYEVTSKLHDQLSVYKEVSYKHRKEIAEQLPLSFPVINRAVVPTGYIDILAETSTGVKTVFPTELRGECSQGCQIIAPWCPEKRKHNCE